MSKVRPDEVILGSVGIESTDERIELEVLKLSKPVGVSKVARLIM